MDFRISDFKMWIWDTICVPFSEKVTCIKIQQLDFQPCKQYSFKSSKKLCFGPKTTIGGHGRDCCMQNETAPKICYFHNFSPIELVFNSTFFKYLGFFSNIALSH